MIGLIAGWKPLLLSLLAVVSMSASTLTGEYRGMIWGTGVDASLDGGKTWKFNAAGPLSHHQTGGDFEYDALGAGSRFVAFCLDVTEHIGTGVNYAWDVVDPSKAGPGTAGLGYRKVDAIAELLGRFYPVFGNAISAEQGGALQIAIWEIVHESAQNWNVTSGSVQFKGAWHGNTLRTAQKFLASLNGSGPKAENLFALHLDGVQDQLIQAAVPLPPTPSLNEPLSPPPPSLQESGSGQPLPSVLNPESGFVRTTPPPAEDQAIPEPATFAMLLPVLFGLGIYGKRRRVNA